MRIHKVYFWWSRESMTLNILSKCIIKCNREIPLPLSSLYKLTMSWGCRSYGRALATQARGMGKEAIQIGHLTVNLRMVINCNREITLHLSSLYKLPILWQCSLHGDVWGWISYISISYDHILRNFHLIYK